METLPQYSSRMRNRLFIILAFSSKRCCLRRAFSSLLSGCLGVAWFEAGGVGTIVGRLFSGAISDYRTKRFGYYASGANS